MFLNAFSHVPLVCILEESSPLFDPCYPIRVVRGWRAVYLRSCWPRMYCYVSIQSVSYRCHLLFLGRHVVNFSNILLLTFLCKSALCSFSRITALLCNFLAKEYWWKSCLRNVDEIDQWFYNSTYKWTEIIINRATHQILTNASMLKPMLKCFGFYWHLLWCQNLAD